VPARRRSIHLPGGSSALGPRTKAPRAFSGVALRTQPPARPHDPGRFRPRPRRAAGERSDSADGSREQPHEAIADDATFRRLVGGITRVRGDLDGGDGLASPRDDRGNSSPHPECASTARSESAFARIAVAYVVGNTRAMTSSRACSSSRARSALSVSTWRALGLSDRWADAMDITLRAPRARIRVAA